MQRFRSIGGLLVYYEVRAELRVADDLARELLTLADDQRDAVFRLRADTTADLLPALERLVRVSSELATPRYTPHHPGFSPHVLGSNFRGWRT